MDYKKILKDRRYRLRLLRKLSWVPDSIMVRLQYKIKMGFWPNMKDPKRFSEKLQLYKLKYRNPVMPHCIDKYDVRAFVEQKGFGDILVECYGVYETANEIDWQNLPEKFVAKKTTGGGGINVAIVKDKASYDLERLKNRTTAWTRPRPHKPSTGREWAYMGIEKNRVIMEALLEDPSTDDLVDYKFFCFQGKPFCVQLDSNRQEDHHQNYYDTDWNSLGVHCTYPEGPLVEKPKNFEKMLVVAAMLSEDFPFVRVDLYNVQGKIYFGELTFYPSSGYGKFHPDSFDFELGKHFDISAFQKK